MIFVCSRCGHFSHLSLQFNACALSQAMTRSAIVSHHLRSGSACCASLSILTTIVKILNFPFIVLKMPAQSTDTTCSFFCISNIAMFIISVFVLRLQVSLVTCLDKN